MIKFSHEGKLYRLKFFHDREQESGLFMDGKTRLASRGGQTHAEVDLLREDGLWETTYVGVAFCHPQDNFCKEVGRQIALDDLFKLNPDLSKDLRSAINTAYWNRK